MKNGKGIKKRVITIILLSAVCVCLGSCGEKILGEDKPMAGGGQASAESNEGTTEAVESEDVEVEESEPENEQEVASEEDSSEVKDLIISIVGMEVKVNEKVIQYDEDDLSSIEEPLMEAIETGIEDGLSVLIDGLDGDDQVYETILSILKDAGIQPQETGN